MLQLRWGERGLYRVLTKKIRTVQMPKMDGIESTRKIRELGFTAPIVALTAFDHETNRNACHEAGMNGELQILLL